MIFRNGYHYKQAYQIINKNVRVSLYYFNHSINFELFSNTFTCPVTSAVMIIFPSVEWSGFKGRNCKLWSKFVTQLGAMMAAVTGFEWAKSSIINTNNYKIILSYWGFTFKWFVWIDVIFSERGEETLFLEFPITSPNINATIFRSGEDKISVGTETCTDLGWNVFMAFVLENDIFIP